MTLTELYQKIGGDYSQAMRILRVEKLLDKHIRKFAKNDVCENLIAAGESMDPSALFEAAHAMKGVCANLGLTGLADAASVITEEFRPGNARTMSDDEVREKLESIKDMYANTVKNIGEYERSFE